jgi:hypothetical protein
VGITGTYHCDRAVGTISRTVRAAPSSHAGNGHVAFDVVAAADRTVQVHTFWTAETRAKQPGLPLVFRTCVHGFGQGPPAWGWADIASAAAGHAAVLRWVTLQGTPPAGMITVGGDLWSSPT